MGISWAHSIMSLPALLLGIFLILVVLALLILIIIDLLPVSLDFKSLKVTIAFKE
jgi:hypothetical protein